MIVWAKGWSVRVTDTADERLDPCPKEFFHVAGRLVLDPTIAVADELVARRTSIQGLFEGIQH